MGFDMILTKVNIFYFIKICTMMLLVLYYILTIKGVPYMNENSKTCPFKNSVCDNSCALFIDPQDLNELLLNRLASLGVVDRGYGVCALKTLAMSNARNIFENTTTRRTH